MAKKTAKVWVVVSGIDGSYFEYSKAKETAENLCQEGEHNTVMILEVVKSWEVGVPENPIPKVVEINIEDL